jgi:hypothetical protein
MYVFLSGVLFAGVGVHDVVLANHACILLQAEQQEVLETVAASAMPGPSALLELPLTPNVKTSALAGENAHQDAKKILDNEDPPSFGNLLPKPQITVLAHTISSGSWSAIVAQICRDRGPRKCTRSILVAGESKRNIRGNGPFWEFRGFCGDHLTHPPAALQSQVLLESKGHGLCGHGWFLDVRGQGCCGDRVEHLMLL